jgi:outer membrane protein OmpA-like peptidoglycan-associated protein
MAALLVAGCAATPTPRYEEAKVAVIELGGDRSIADQAPVALAEAHEALEAATAAENPEEIEHRAEVALRRVAIARAEARRRIAERRAEEAAEELEKLQLDLREREVRAALRKAREAEARAERLHMEAEAERRRARSEQMRIDELKQQLAELKPRLTERGLVLTLGEVLFDFDSARLKPYTLRIMGRLASFLNRHGAYVLTVEGHTDSTGNADYNMRLSRERAQSVADALIKRQVSAERIAIRGYGESRPIASNETEAGRRQNRRVEVVINDS